MHSRPKFEQWLNDIFAMDEAKDYLVLGILLAAAIWILWIYDALLSRRR